MERLELDVNDLIDYTNSQRFLYASESKTDRKLYLTARGEYIVEKNGEVIHRGMQPAPAVCKFNEA